MRLSRFAILVLAAAGTAQAAYPEDKLMARIERTVVLPEGAHPLRQYRRHYTWGDDGKTVYAVYVLGGKPRRLWLAKEDMPIYLHGGCNVVSFDYHVIDRSFTDITCF